MLWSFRSINLEHVAGLLSQLSWRVLLVPLPFALAQLTETAGWRETYRELGCVAKYGPLLRVRLACEALAQTLPAGMLIAESLKPGLLMSQVGLNASDAVCGTASRKLLLLTSQCVYFGAAIAIGAPALSMASRDLPWLPTVIVLGWLVLLAAACLLWNVLRGGNVCQRVLQALSSAPSKALRKASEAWDLGFTKTDTRIAELCALGPVRLARSTTLYFIAWCWEAVETVLILRLLGVRLEWETLCLIEVCASMIRHIAFASPAGLGIQDLGYAGLLRSFGVADWLGIAVAFTCLKRGKELFWSVVGYGLLAAMQRKLEPAITEGVADEVARMEPSMAGRMRQPARAVRAHVT
jgi:hypothetical protein